MTKESATTPVNTDGSVSNQDPNALVTPDEIAAECRVQVTTVTAWLRDGKLRGTKLGGGVWRVTRRALAEFKGELELFGGEGE